MSPVRRPPPRKPIPIIAQRPKTPAQIIAKSPINKSFNVPEKIVGQPATGKQSTTTTNFYTSFTTGQQLVAQGQHPQQTFRTTAWGGAFSHAALGAAGGTLEAEICRFELRTLDLQGWIDVGRVGRFHVPRDSELLSIIRQTVYMHLRQRLEDLIMEKVPARTHRLQEMYIRSIGGKTGYDSSISQVRSLHPFQVVLSSGSVEYASVVNNMQTRNVAHYGEWSPMKKGERTKGVKTATGPRGGKYIVLEDPKAIQNHFEEIVTEGRRYAQQLWDNMIRGPMSNAFLDTWLYARKLFRNLTKEQLAESLFEVTFG